MRLTAVTWASDMPLLAEAASSMGIDLKGWSVQQILNPECLLNCIRSLKEADLILLHPTQDGALDQVLASIDGTMPVISFGLDPDLWKHSNQPPRIVSTVNLYILYGGSENIENMLRYLGREILGLDYDYELPKATFWEGIYHPDSAQAFSTIEEYMEWYRPRIPCHRSTVGVLFFRTYWANSDLEVVNALIRELEKDLNVIAAFCLSLGDRDLGARSSGEVMWEFFKGRVDAVVNLQSLFNAGCLGDSVQVLKDLDVPVFHPLTAYHKTEEEWMESSYGLTSSEVGWSVAMPEFEGLIEPILAGTAVWGGTKGGEYELHQGISERVLKIGRRIRKWIALRIKPVSERRVAFVLHNSPCASVEASVGSAAHLDSLESMARILQRMAESGYLIDSPPPSGEELIRNIMEKKAISEFRWTTVEEIVSRGGALDLVKAADYEAWFETLPEDARDRVCQAWGKPPGETRNGVSASMIYKGDIVVTGVRYGNAVVSVQPKRGCAGSRCDGQACVILHDPEVPPPHQYLATYHYLQDSFGADLIVHVGTHGNLEFLPGKSVALSGGCFPDIAMGDLPHLYIYNSDNPPEGTIAKRRSYAVLVDHMQAVMTISGTYGFLKELEERIAEYRRTKVSEEARAHAVEHLILDLLRRSRMAEEIDLDCRLAAGSSFEEILQKAHGKISEMYSTWIPDGMHIFGEVPAGDARIEMICSIMNQDAKMRRLIRLMMERHGTEYIYPGPGDSDPVCDESVLIDRLSRKIISAIIDGEPVGSDGMGTGGSGDLDEPLISQMRDQVMDISSRIDASDEMGSLLRGFGGRFIEPGPSGLITRGRSEVLPTGRNFYSLDPASIPTEAAWRVGKKLARAILDRYMRDFGRMPENIGMYWMANDIMWADGEELAQMLYLAGMEPVWKSGKVNGLRVIPLEKLGRPRIDLTVRVSGITRDCFYNCVELLDQAIKTAALLDEPLEMNYIRKHGPENHHIFASRPGTYGSGVNLAVYASAWKDESDLTDVFMQWNSYAYGKGIFGEESTTDLAHQLKSVDLTFNKTVTDEYDLLGCCCYFGTHGGLTSAARAISGKDVRSYYGDTRDREKVEVRTLADELRRIARTKLLNPRWIEGMKRHGYKGAGDISKRVGRVYGWEATTGDVDDWIFDEIARTFILDREMRRFFQEKNPWAMEEMGRRLLEAQQRGLWKADKEVLDALKSSYLEIEGWMEDLLGDSEGSFQGGSIDVIPLEIAGRWRGRADKEMPTASQAAREHKL